MAFLVETLFPYQKKFRNSSQRVSFDHARELCGRFPETFPFIEHNQRCIFWHLSNQFTIRRIIKLFSIFLARRRAAAKRKKLKNLGKSKSTDTEEEDADDDCGDDGELVELSVCDQNRYSVDWL